MAPPPLETCCSKGKSVHWARAGRVTDPVMFIAVRSSMVRAMNYEDEEGLVLQTGLRGSRDSVQFVTLNHCTEQGNCETATNVKWLNLT